MSKWFKWNMFFTSFLPLWVSIVVSDIWSMVIKYFDYIDKNKDIAFRTQISELFILCRIEIVTILVLIIYCFISIHNINRTIKKFEKENSISSIGKIVSAKRANKLSAEFLLAYILPMIAFDFSASKSIVLFLIYFSVLSMLCIWNNNVYTNILFEFKGYRMYECNIQCEVLAKKHLYEDILILSKSNLAMSLPREIKYFDFENYIYIEIGVCTNE